MKRILFLSLITLLMLSIDANAADRYWTGAADNSWSNTNNWSTSSGGAGGASVPGSGDVANFDANGLVDCSLDAAVNVAGLQVAAGYTMTITQSTNTITIGASGATLSGGIFSGGSANITVSGAFTISGCAFTSTSGLYATNSNFTVSSGSFTHNNGTVKFTATATITGSFTLYNLKFSPSSNSTYTVSNTLTVDNNLYFEGSSVLTLNTGTVDVKKDVYASNTGGATTGGTGTVKFSGTTRQILYGHNGFSGPIPNVIINKSDTLAIQDTICIGGNFTRTAGEVSAGTSNVVFKEGNGSTITGSTALYDVTFFTWTNNSTYTIASGNTLTVTRRLLYTGDQILVINTGTIAVQGDMKNSNTYGGGGGSGTLLFNGSGTQTLTGLNTAGVGHLCDVTINKTSTDTLKLVSKICVRGDWTRTSGVVSAGTSLVRFTETKTITGTQELYDVDFTGTASVIITIASGSTLTVNHTLTTLSSLPISFNGTIHAKGDITISNTGAGTGTGTFVINGDGDQTLDGPAGDNQGRLPNVHINKTQGTLTLADHISIYGNWTHTAGVLVEGTSTVFFVGTKTITGLSGTGLDTLYNVIFSGASAYTYTISGSTTLTVSNALTFDGSSAITLNSGTIHAGGNITTSNSSTSTTGTATIVINGAGSQTLTGSGTAGTGKLPNITIDKSTGTLSLASIISCTGNWVYVDGTVSPGTSAVALYGTFNLDGQGTSGTMSFYRLQVTTGTRTLTGNIDANDNFTISSGATCVGGSYTINVGANWNSQGTWTYGTSTVVFDGSGYHRIQGASGTVVNFGSITLNRRAAPGSVTLVNPVKINTSMTFALGRLKTTTTNYLEFADNATCTVSNDDSAYVHGPVRKTGDDAFSFPLGDTTLHDSIAYHPLAISAPGSTGDRFEAVYNAVGQTLGSTIVDSLYDLSTCEKWSLERQQGTSDVLVTLSWNRNSCNTDVYGNMRVANWDGSGWADLGASAISVLYGGKGTVTSSGNPTYVSSFAYLTTAVARNNFPTAILHKKLDGGYYKAVNGRLFFRFDEEYYDTGDLIFNIYDDEHTLVSSNSMMPAIAQPQVVYGDNRFRLNTVGCEITPSGPLADGFYTLEVINDKNERWYLRFEQDANIMIGNCPPPTEAE